MVAVNPIGSDVEVDIHALLGDVKREVDISRKRRIFCNRNLKMASIELIGFDMDYTLALYQQDQLEALSIRLTLDNLIRHAGYPEAIRDLRYDPVRAIRGVCVDRRLGNVFKMDRHGYVGRVFHGLRSLSKQERRNQYRRARVNPSHARYSYIDTLFALPEAVMYLSLVDYFDRNQLKVSYRKLFEDIRENIDLAHRDDTLKTAIKANLSAYIIKDPDLAETLHKLRSSGKRMFLLTNSYYPYTRVVMSYLLDGVRSAYPSWRNYFDVIIVGGRKPGFFTKREPFIALDVASGEPVPGEVRKLSRGRIYQGGNIIDFERMTGAMGEQVLYVGDHIYGDILKLKKAHVWRTAMVIQELERENQIGEGQEERLKDMSVLDRRRRNLESEIDYQILLLKRIQKLLDGPIAAERPALREQLEQAREQARRALDSLKVRVRLMQEEVVALEDSIDLAYNPYWGPMFREGNENSSFGKQVWDYADLYTSRVSNFLSYSPVRYFRSPRRKMPHEL